MLMPDLNVLLVDDNDAFRLSTAWVLEHAQLKVREFSCAAALLDALSVTLLPLPCCIVTDMRMPGMNGLELMDALQKQHVDMPVILITGHGDIPLAVEAMRRGAASVLEKPFAGERLVQAIFSAMAEPGARLKNPQEARVKLDRLTPREKQVMDLVCLGHLSKTIADKLGISVKTVELHRANLMAKLRVRSVQELVRLTLGYE